MERLASGFVPHGQEPILEGQGSVGSIRHSFDAERALGVGSGLIRSFPRILDFDRCSADGCAGDGVHNRALDHLRRERRAENQNRAEEPHTKISACFARCVKPPKPRNESTNKRKYTRSMDGLSLWDFNWVMTRCNECNGIIARTDSERHICGEPVPGLKSALSCARRRNKKKLRP